jgi:hypothetical protein
MASRVHSRAPLLTPPGPTLLHVGHVPPLWFLTTSTVYSALRLAGLLHPATERGSSLTFRHRDRGRGIRASSDAPPAKDVPAGSPASLRDPTTESKPSSNQSAEAPRKALLIQTLPPKRLVAELASTPSRSLRRSLPPRRSATRGTTGGPDASHPAPKHRAFRSRQTPKPPRRNRATRRQVHVCQRRRRKRGAHPEAWLSHRQVFLP